MKRNINGLLACIVQLLHQGGGSVIVLLLAAAVQYEHVVWHAPLAT